MELVLAEKEALTGQSQTWTDIFKRLNAIVLSIRTSIFQRNLENSQEELNFLSQMLTININMLENLINEKQMSNDEFGENVRFVFMLHIKFDTFIFTDFKMEIGKTEDFGYLNKFLQKNYSEIYSGLDLEDIILTFADSGKVYLTETPKKFQSKSSNHWSERSSQNRNSNQNTFNRGDSWKPNWEGQNKSPWEDSPGPNSMTFKKKKQPQEEEFQEKDRTLKEEDFPDVEDVSIKTDSELEGLRENTRKLEALQATPRPQKGFADVLKVDQEDQSQLASR